MNGYLVPANAKKGTLIANIFRPVDLFIFGTGLLITFCLLMVFSPKDLLSSILVLSPALVTGFLVIPVPNYHNMMCAIISIWSFYNTRRRYIWKGWCFYEQFSEEKRKNSK